MSTKRVDDPALAAVVDRVQRGATAWFGELDPDLVRPVVGHSRRRPRCDLIRLDLSDGRRTASVMAKIRHAPPGAPVAAGRPGLMPAEPLSDPELARLEVAGLRVAVEAWRPDDRWAPVRPLALIPEHAAIVMDFVPHPTLRQVLMARTRGRSVPQTGAEWSAAGTWLRRYHERNPTDVVPTERNGRRADMISLLYRYTDYLLAHVPGRTARGRSAVARTGESAVSLAERRLPDTLPMVTGHGDFAPRNVLVAPDGRVAVIDPLPRWRVPAYEDVCRFLVNIRCVGLQVASNGVAFGREELHRCEDAFLTGYYGSDACPHGAVRAYAVLILLDKWASAVANAGDPVRRLWYDRFYRHEVARLIESSVTPARPR